MTETDVSAMLSTVVNVKRTQHLSCLRPASSLAVLSLVFLGALPIPAQTSTNLFPEPFAVEHYVLHDDGHRGVMRTDVVTDYYGGSWIVSVRPNGSRMIVDLERRQLTEVDAARGSYWSLSFDRFAELHNRLMALEGSGADLTETGAPVPPTAASRAIADGAAPDFEIVEMSTESAASRATVGAIPGEPAPLSASPAVRHLRVSLQAGSQLAPPRGAAQPAVEVWVDTRVRFTPAALRALESFEETVAGGRYAEGRGILSPGRYVAAARTFAEGALPVRTRRPLDMTTGQGTLEDVSLRIERIEGVPQDLVSVPDGLQRVPHPWEIAVSAGELEERVKRGDRR